MQPEAFDWYRTLEVRPGATAEEIKEAYLDLVRVWHPDRLQGEHPRLRHKAEEKLKALNVAYGRLVEQIALSPEDGRAASPNGAPMAAPVNIDAAAAAALRPRYFGGLWGYVNDKGKVVLAAKYIAAEGFRSGLACVKLSTGHYGFIAASGELAIPADFERAHGFSEGLAAVRVKGKWGYILTTGAFAVHPVFDDARSFRQEIGAVKLGGKWGFISKTGDFLISPRFEQADDFDAGWAWVKMPGARERVRVNARGEMFAGAVDQRPKPPAKAARRSK